MLKFDYGEIYLDGIRQSPAMLMDYILKLQYENRVLQQLLEDLDEGNSKRTYGNIGSDLAGRHDTVPDVLAQADNALLGSGG